MIVSSSEIRREWGQLVTEVLAGEPVIVANHGKPLVAIIPFEDFVALQGQLEDLSDVRLANAALAEYRLNPARARPLAELMAEWGDDEEEVSTASDVDSSV